LQPAESETEELVDADDRRIGAAFRISLWIIGILAVITLGVYLAMRAPRPVAPIKEAVIQAPLPQDAPPVAVAPALFRDVTRASGVRFVHRNGAYGEKLLPETMGGGVAVIDVRGNGRADLLFVDSGGWPWKDGAAEPTLHLYLNDGRGQFSDATSGSGLEPVRLYGMGIAVGDVDNDGFDDIVVTGVGGVRLLRNLGGGGKFADVTREAGIAAAPEDWYTCAAFVDTDNDGLLDLFLCRYVRWSREIDRAIDFRMTGIGRAYGQPTTFEGTSPRLLRNVGNRRFADVSEKAGMRVLNPATGRPIAKSLGVLPVDVDRDGWIDLVVANDTVRNFLFLNRKGVFEEAGMKSGLAYDVNGNARGAMGIDAAHWRNDAQLAIAIGNFANEMSSFYVGGADARFDDQAIVSGIGPATRRALTFGVLFFDYDLDGRPDLFHANGHIEDEINKVQASQQYAQPMQLFWNCGDPCPQVLVEVPAAQRGALAQAIVGRGAAYADLDGDGDPDLVVTQIGGPALVLRNDHASGNHWLRVRLEGTGKINRDAIGSWVELAAGGVTRRAQVMPTRGYLSQVERTLTFGLGKAKRVDKLTVHWSDGTRQAVEVPGVDRVIHIRKP
jgi:enediyne biosynthesis protein E4